MSIFERLRLVLLDQIEFDIEPSKLTWQSTLETLGVEESSLDIADIHMGIEEEFDIELTDDEMTSLYKKQLRLVVRFINRKISSGI